MNRTQHEEDDKPTLLNKAKKHTGDIPRYRHYNEIEKQLIELLNDMKEGEIRYAEYTNKDQYLRIRQRALYAKKKIRILHRIHGVTHTEKDNTKTYRIYIEKLRTYKPTEAKQQ